MKIVLVEGPNKVVVRETADPQVGDYDALCEILFGATCSGTDLHLIRGEFPYAKPFPTIPGHESIGRVLKVGNKVRHYQPGDLVTRVGAPPSPTGEYTCTWGGFAEMGVAKDHWAMCADGLPRAEWDAFRVNKLIPTGIDPAEATMIITWRETLSLITRMGAGPGSRVLVIGSGGNGLAYGAHAANLGAAQVTMVGAPAREPTARAIGVTDYLSYKEPELRDRLAAICPERFDFAIDAVGKMGIGDLALTVLKDRGMLTIYGIDDLGRCTVLPTGSTGTFTYYNNYLDEEETHERVLDFMRRGRLDARHWLDLDHPFDLADFPAAVEAIATRKVVKALVRMRGQTFN